MIGAKIVIFVCLFYSHITHKTLEKHENAVEVNKKKNK